MNCSIRSTGISLVPHSKLIRRMPNRFIPTRTSFQFSMITSGVTSSERISSPLGMSFTSARSAAADADVSIPAARWRCARRSLTTFTGASTNHLRRVSQWSGCAEMSTSQPSRLQVGLIVENRPLWDVTSCTDLHVVCLPPSSRLEVGLAGLLTSLWMWHGRQTSHRTTLRSDPTETVSTKCSCPRLLLGECEKI